MSAWIEDAQVLTEVRELNRSEHSVLLRTTAVQEFLENVQFVLACGCRSEGVR